MMPSALDDEYDRGFREGLAEPPDSGMSLVEMQSPNEWGLSKSDEAKLREYLRGLQAGRAKRDEALRGRQR